MTIRRGSSIIAGALGELPSQTGQSGKYLTTNGSAVSWSDIQSGSSRNIGEIVSSTIPLTDAGLHLLDGALISGSGAYSDFVTYIAGLVSSYPDLFDTEANWQSTVLTYGVCGKFVYDSTNNTVRLPKYSDKIWATSVSNNGTVTYDMTTTNKQFTRLPDSSNAQFQPGSGMTMYAENGDMATTSGKINIDPNGTLKVDLSGITSPLEGYWYIVVATSTKTQIEVDIDQIATDLNGKADIDLSNCTAPHITETYVNGSDWYIVYSNKLCIQGGNYTTAMTVAFLKAYPNTNYTLIVASNTPTTYNSSIPLFQMGWYGNKTSSGFTGYADSNLTKEWVAYGYIS